MHGPLRRIETLHASSDGDCPHRRSFFTDIAARDPAQLQPRPSYALQVRDSMQQGPTGAMSHPLWDSPDSPLQAGRVSTMQHPNQFHPQAPNGMAGGEYPALGAISQPQDGTWVDGQWAAPRRTTSRNQAPPSGSDPTLNGLRARYSKDQVGSPPRSDGLLRGMHVSPEPVGRPSRAPATQWDGAAGATSGRPSMAGPLNAYDGAPPRQSMIPPRASEMPRRTSMAMPDHQQPRMSMYAMQPPPSSSRRGTRDTANGYDAGQVTIGYNRPDQDPRAYQDDLQQGGGMGGQSELMRVRSSGGRQSMLARQLQEEPAGWQAPSQPSRPSVAPHQQGSMMSAHLDRTFSTHG